jgi:hypothetical protein
MALSFWPAPLESHAESRSLVCEPMETIGIGLPSLTIVALIDTRCSHPSTSEGRQRKQSIILINICEKVGQPQYSKGE